MAVKVEGKSIFIVHFSPLEAYPPVMNAIRFLEKKKDPLRIKVFTTAPLNKDFRFSVKNKSVSISRLGKSGPSASVWNRLYSYFVFNLVTLFQLLIHRPAGILYYESLSAFAPLMYKKWFNRSVKIYIHYHEYTSPVEYENGMWQVKQYHKLEKKMYPQVNWISHTNENRMGLFESDNKSIWLPGKQIMPNYPPPEWKEAAGTKVKLTDNPVRVVYVGSMGLSTMYLKEFAGWVNDLKGKIHWDIYSYNAGEDVINFINQLNCPFIRLLAPVDYYELPAVLRKYDVGIILYKGYAPNWIYNIPNKLFEYHVCGLDVWYPSDMISPERYITGNEYPQIIKLDFDKLIDYDPNELVSRANKNYRVHDFNADEVLEKLYQQLV
jgi:hypothetical protein